MEGRVPLHSVRGVRKFPLPALQPGEGSVRIHQHRKLPAGRAAPHDAGIDRVTREASSRVPGGLSPVALNPLGQTGQQVQKHRTLWHDARRRFFRNRLAVLGLAIVCFFLFLAIFADVLAPYSYKEVDFTVRHPQLPFVHPKYLLGTDPTGRDYLSRLIYGARTSMTIGILIQTVALLIGVPLGGLAGYLGGKFDFVVTRLIEIMTAFPGLLFAILIVSAFGGGRARRDGLRRLRE